MNEENHDGSRNDTPAESARGGTPEAAQPSHRPLIRGFRVTGQGPNRTRRPGDRVR